MRKYKHNINSEIAFTHLFTRKKQSFVAALGVTVGIAIFIFMNSLMNGLEVYSVENLVKSTPHLRIYKDDQLSRSLKNASDNNSILLIANPKITSESKRIIDPVLIMMALKKEPEITGVTPNVSGNVFYSSGDAQVSGKVSGIKLEEHNKMFNVEQYIVDGQYNALAGYQNGIVLGTGIAEKLNLKLGDDVTVTSSYGVSKLMKIVALLQTGSTATDKKLGYINLSAAQQLQRQGPSYITDIFVNIREFEKATQYIPQLKALTGYDVEDWETANAAAAAANKIRKMMAMAISFSIMLVAAFGIYNILNMTITQKLNYIAILKAMGFSGKDVVFIFVREAIVIGIIGILIGLGVGAVLIKLMSNFWVGGDVGFFPIRFFPKYFGFVILFGLVVTTLAGYIPARKAAHVDPISIFRR